MARASGTSACACLADVEQQVDALCADVLNAGSRPPAPEVANVALHEMATSCMKFFSK